MSIDLSSAPDISEIQEHYGLTAGGLAEIVKVISTGLSIGAFDLDDERDGADLVQGFREAVAYIKKTGIEIPDGPALDIIKASEFVIDLAEQAEADGRKVTIRSIGLAVSRVAISLVQSLAESGDEDAIEAVALAKAKGLA